MEMSYNELRERDVINIRDGACLGRVNDLVFDVKSAEITAIIVPGKKGWKLFSKSADIYIDWCKITKIGSDVILVDLQGGGRRFDKKEYEEERYPKKGEGRFPCPPPPSDDNCRERPRPPINPYDY